MMSNARAEWEGSELGWIDPGTLDALRDIIEARILAPIHRQSLLRAVAGAVRPNRDRPIWDLCWLVADLAGALRSQPSSASRASGDRLVGLLLDTSGEALALLARQTTPRRYPPNQARSLLALADFLLTHDDCSAFAEVRAAFDAIAAAGDETVEAAIRTAVATLAQRLRAHRIAHFAVGQHEKAVRSLLGFMTARGRTSASIAVFDDEDILAYWEHMLAQEGRMMFRTAIQYVIAFRAVIADRATERSVSEAASIADGEAFDDGTVRAIDADDASVALDCLSALSPDDLTRLLDGGMPDDVKALTGAERERLAELTAFHDFPRQLPLTVLRALSFGAVQTGISNFLRRGSGGAAVAHRATCRDATGYAEMLDAHDRLLGHLERLLLIAAHLTGDAADHPGLAAQRDAIATKAEAALKRIQRAGFDDRARLAAVLRDLTPALLQLSDLVRTFLERARRLERLAPLQDRFETDRQRFAQLLSRAYAGPSVKGSFERP